MIGTKISHYRIIEKLGEGGMGIVYKAHDTKLNRNVALKFLKAISLGSEEDKIRFVTEAQAAASLDHPNICTIHAIEEVEGGTFIAMAYIEGESLQARIQRGPLKIEEVLDISIQIAEGLNQAHQRGIIHRDIKSANILISALGLVKIMDFGLARLAGRTTLTKEGTTLGTPSYMSPEQARGEKVDHRTDIWSLGVIMYEMVTGRLPFRGDYQEAVVYSILNEPPEPPTAVRTGVPMDIEKIIAKAMAKNANERYQHLDELLVDLRREKKITEQRESSQKIPVRGMEQSSWGSRIVGRGKPLHKRPGMLIGASIMLIGIVVGVYVFGSKSSEPRNQMVTRVLRIPSNEANDPNISPDGHWVVYVVPNATTGSAVYIQAASGGEPKKIVGDTLYKESPCFSTDETEIFYDQDDGRDPTTGRSIHNIYKVSVLGGSPRKMISDGQQPIWSPDGKAIAFMRYGETKRSIWLANPDGSLKKQVTEEQDPLWSEFAWSPDSKSLAFMREVRSEEGGSHSELFVLDLSSGQQQQWTFDKKPKRSLCWAATNEIIFSLRQGVNVNLWIVPGGGGTPRPLTSELGQILGPRISKDAKHLIYTIYSGSFDLWAMDLETKQSRQLTFDEGVVMDPVFSPQGNKLLYWWLHNGTQLMVSNADGSEPIEISPLFGWPGAARWSGDGKLVAYSALRSDTVSVKPDSVHNVNDIFIQDLENKNARKIGKGILVDWSSDGKYMLLQQENSPSNQNTYILALTNSLDKPIKEIKPVIEPSFTHDSKNVLCTDSTRLWSMSIESGQRSVICSLPKGFLWVREMPDGQSIGVGIRSPANEKVWTFLKISKSGKNLEKLFEARDIMRSPSYSPDMKTCVFSKTETRNKIVIVDNFR